MATQTTKLKKNVEGFRDHLGIFHPIRKGVKEQGELYDGDLSGDNDDVFDAEIRKAKNQQKAEELEQKRALDYAMEGALGAERKQSLSQFVRSSGGLRYDEKTTDKAERGELRRLSFKESKKRGIAHKNGSSSPDRMREAADEAGYNGIHGDPLKTVDDFLVTLEADLYGTKKIYPLGGIGTYKFNPRDESAYWTKYAGHLLRLMKIFKRRGKPAKAKKLEKARKHALKLASLAKQKEAMKANPSKTKKRTPAKQAAKPKKRTTAKPKKNGLLETLATAAVGASAAFNVYDRVKRNKPVKPATGANAVIHESELKNNKSNSAYHEQQFDSALVAIESGNLTKIKTAKLQGKLAGYSQREIDTFIQRARLTSKLKNNPTPATIRQAENSLLKENGFIKRALARQKAARLYKRQLKLESALDRAKKKRAGAEAKAKKNPDKFTNELLKKIYQNGKNSLANKKLNSREVWTIYSDEYKYFSSDGETVKLTKAGINELTKLRKNPAKLKQNRSKSFEEFQGRPSTKTLELVTPEGAPKHLYCLGKLFELRLKGKNNIDFRRETTGKMFYLCADERNKQLWIAGGKVAAPDNSIKKGFSEPYAIVTHVIYETKKDHLDDDKKTGYIHKFGEEGGEQPTLAFDRDGFPIIAGGEYEITPLGIAD